jgi:D-alanyl-lipoteichoic acid acyltransferase DltB (MBOAT superfamily)
MLFNSHIFLFVFLPLTLLGFYLLGRLPRGKTLCLGWLLAASYLFYGYWNPPFLLLLVGLTLANFLAASTIRRAPRNTARWICHAAVLGNLAVLAYYKYALFFLGILSPWTGNPDWLPEIILPIGLSFYTFQQIAFLRDTLTHPESTRFSLLEYAFLITFFPQLIAGPIIHHHELLPQCSSAFNRFRLRRFAPGIALFLIGLCKKAVFADRIAPISNLMFDTAAAGTLPGTADAWIGTIAYSLQLYFDFSGYSDMACGLALMFNFKLPVNFDSPYQSTSIVEFWRRWHITLSRFLRDYLYIPLGGSRGTGTRTILILITTMLLGGLWHGAGWTFVIWGGYHGCALAINHLWKRLASTGKVPTLPRFIAWPLTLIVIMIGWVFFRAENLTIATGIISRLFSLTPPTTDLWETVKSNQFVVMAILGIATLTLPNSHRWLARTRPAITASLPPAPTPWNLKKLRPALLLHPLGALTLGILFIIILFNMPAVSEFIYFQF